MTSSHHRQLPVFFFQTYFRITLYLRSLFILVRKTIGCFFKFHLIVGVRESIVDALYGLRITHQLFKSYVFTRVMRSQSTFQRLLGGEISKYTRYKSDHFKVTKVLVCYFH
jgi:hypothetical protein